MKKSLLIMLCLTLSLFMCGCGNSTNEDEGNQCSENECSIEETNEGNIVEEEIIEIPVAEKLEGDNMITVSVGDIDSPSIPESDVFEAPIQ